MGCFDKTEAILKRGIEELAFPSAVVAIGDKDGVYFKKAFGYARVIMDDTAPTGVFSGDIPPNAVRASVSTLYDIASLSKLVSTTMIALRFLEDGMITLYDTVGRFFPAPQDKADITIKQLMTHSGGFAPYLPLPQLCRNRDDILPVLLSHPLDYLPGSKVVYSCMGYILLGHILEAVGGAPLDVLAEQQVFAPLSMTHTGYNPMTNPKMRRMKIATTEYSDRLGRYVHGEVHDSNAHFAGGVSGNAGVFSTVDDLCRFARMLAGEGRIDGSDENRFLVPETLRLATQNHTAFASEHRGLGFALSNGGLYPTGDLFGLHAYGHTGFTGTSLFVSKENGMFLILLTNRVHYTRQNMALMRYRRILHNTAMAEYGRMIAKGDVSAL